jgi:ferredoxin
VSELITETKLRQLAGEWIDGGKPVVGPVRIEQRALYQRLQSPEALLLESIPGALRPANSIKEFFFPKQETLYQYRLHGRNIELIEPAQEFAEQLIVAARPCDAAALPILDHVFNWDFVDDFYNRRRTATTIVTVACRAADESCFCTSVGLGPDDTRGSDAILLDLGSSRYEVRCITAKGQALFSGKTETSKESGKAAPPPEVKFDPGKIRTFVDGHFEDPIWAEHGRSCMACGVCAFSCPTCHCFDIVDLGHMPVSDLHAARFRTQSKSASAGAATAAHSAQVFNLSRKVRRDPLHRLR